MRDQMGKGRDKSCVVGRKKNNIVETVIEWKNISCSFSQSLIMLRLVISFFVFHVSVGANTLM